MEQVAGGRNPPTRRVRLSKKEKNQSIIRILRALANDLENSSGEIIEAKWSLFPDETGAKHLTIRFKKTDTQQKRA